MIGEQHPLFATAARDGVLDPFRHTLDVCTRPDAILQELLGWTSCAGALLATAITVVTHAAIFLEASGEGSLHLLDALRDQQPAARRLA